MRNAATVKSPAWRAIKGGRMDGWSNVRVVRGRTGRCLVSDCPGVSHRRPCYCDLLSCPRSRAWIERPIRQQQGANHPAVVTEELAPLAGREFPDQNSSSRHEGRRSSGKRTAPLTATRSVSVPARGSCKIPDPQSGVVAPDSARWPGSSRAPETPFSGAACAPVARADGSMLLGSPAATARARMLQRDWFSRRNAYRSPVDRDAQEELCPSRTRGEW
jgi:hypothetical protein